MAREASPEGELPNPEARRRILQRAGLVLKRAQALVAQLDRHESIYPRIICDYGSVIPGINDRQRLDTLNTPVPAAISNASKEQRPSPALAG